MVIVIVVVEVVVIVVVAIVVAVLRPYGERFIHKTPHFPLLNVTLRSHSPRQHRKGVAWVSGARQVTMQSRASMS